MTSATTHQDTDIKDVTETVCQKALGQSERKGVNTKVGLWSSGAVQQYQITETLNTQLNGIHYMLKWKTMIHDIHLTCNCSCIDIYIPGFNLFLVFVFDDDGLG